MTKEQRENGQFAISLAFFIVWSAYCGWVVCQEIRSRHEMNRLRARIADRLAAHDAAANIGFTWNNAEGEGHDGEHRVPALEPGAEPG